MPVVSADELFAELTVESFIADYLEKQVMHLELNDPVRVAGIFGLDEMGECIRYRQPWHAEKVRVVPHGEAAEETPLLSLMAAKEGRVESFLLAGFSEKKTIIFNNAEQYWEPVSRIVASLQEALECSAICNIYCTPPQSQGFNTHVDSHDVLVLQSHGTKVWRIHDVQTSLPVEKSAIGRRIFPNLESALPDFREPTREVVLHPGDVLYLPRGVPHSAASTDEVSIHLTIGLHPERTHQFLAKLVDLLALEDEGLRRRVPIEAMRGDQPLPDLPEMLRDLADRAERLDSAADPNRLIEILREDYRAAGDSSGAIYSAAYAERTNGSSLVAHPSGARFVWRRTASELVVSCGQCMSLPLKVEPLIDFIAENATFRVADLPDSFAPEAKVVLVRNMIKNGVLRLISVGSPEVEGPTAP